MRTYLTLLLVALVACDFDFPKEKIEYVSEEKDVTLYYSLTGFLTCLSKNKRIQENIPFILKKIIDIINKEDYRALLDYIINYYPEYLDIVQNCLYFPQQAQETEPVLLNIFSDIGDIIKEAFGDILSIGKNAWSSAIAGIENLVKDGGQTIINDIWEGLKATGKSILEDLLVTAKDTLKNLILDALTNPGDAIENFKNAIKGLPDTIKKGALGFRLPEGCVTQMTIDEIKNLISGVRDDVRKEVREACEQGRAYGMEVCKKLISTDKLDLCNYFKYF